jgi:release factor glutamine methyltransferase
MERLTGTELGQELVSAAEDLSAAGVDTPQLDAELLMGHVTGFSRTQLITRSRLALSEPQVTHFRHLVAKRRERYPLPYLIGVWQFWGMEFEVNPSTLIPRPETEGLVEACLEWLRGRPSILVDIGTGSGAIAVALAKELPEIRVYATEISPQAAHTAERNAEKNGVADRVEVLVGDLVAPLTGKGLEGRVDAIVSNPPYIADEAGPTLQPEVKQEPGMATLAGPDPLVFYRRILLECGSFLKPGGRVFFEIDPGLSASIVEIGRRARFRFVELRNDLAGFERVLVLECES